MKNQFSVCIITRDEADKLEKCLKAARRLQAEIVVVDTGSVDDSVKIMKQYADICGSFVWCDDFAQAKNYAAALASNDWILTLDTDEYVMEFDLEELEKMMKTSPMTVGCIYRKNHYIQDKEQRVAYTWTDRFYNRKYYRYYGRIHEQLLLISDEGNLSKEVVELHVTIEHDSYENTQEGMCQKAKRNKKLLLLDLQEYGEQPYTLYQLGKSCYTLQEYKEAADYLSRGLEFDLDPSLEYVIDMVETYGYALLNSGQAEVALGLESVYDTFSQYAGFVFLMGNIYMKVGMLEEAIGQFLKATTLPDDKQEGTNSYLAFYNIGVIYECCGLTDEAEKYYARCGDYQRAKERLAE